MRINKNSVFKLKIIRIDFYRDCSTAGVLVQIDHEGGFTETVEYLIHGHNSANKRMDVTRDGVMVQAYPSFYELKALQTALYDLDVSDPAYKGNHDAKVAVMLSGMVMSFMHWLKAHNENDIKLYAPEAAEERKRKEPFAEAVDEMTAQLAESLEKSAFAGIGVDLQATDAAIQLKTIIESAKKLGAERISLDLKVELEAPVKQIRLEGLVSR